METIQSIAIEVVKAPAVLTEHEIIEFANQADAFTDKLVNGQIETCKEFDDEFVKLADFSQRYGNMGEIEADATLAPVISSLNSNLFMIDVYGVGFLLEHFHQDHDVFDALIEVYEAPGLNSLIFDTSSVRIKHLKHAFYNTFGKKQGKKEMWQLIDSLERIGLVTVEDKTFDFEAFDEEFTLDNLLSWVEFGCESFVDFIMGDEDEEDGDEEDGDEEDSSDCEGCDGKCENEIPVVIVVGNKSTSQNDDEDEGGEETTNAPKKSVKQKVTPKTSPDESDQVNYSLVFSDNKFVLSIANGVQTQIPEKEAEKLIHKLEDVFYHHANIS